MYTQILGNLDRQAKALDLLLFLQEEEFSLLVEHDTNNVMSLEFSIQELLRQLAVEKEGVMRRLGGGKVMDYVQMLEPEQGQALTVRWQHIDSMEQKCARQATNNTKLSLALLDQSKEMLDYLHSRLLPPKQDTYGRRGRYVQHHPEASLISNKL